MTVSPNHVRSRWATVASGTPRCVCRPPARRPRDRVARRPRSQRIGGLQRLTALDTPPAPRAVADLDVEAAHDGTHRGKIFLILRRNPIHGDPAAAARARRCPPGVGLVRRGPAAGSWRKGAACRNPARRAAANASLRRSSCLRKRSRTRCSRSRLRCRRSVSCWRWSFSRRSWSVSRRRRSFSRRRRSRCDSARPEGFSCPPAAPVRRSSVTLRLCHIVKVPGISGFL